MQPLPSPNGGWAIPQARDFFELTVLGPVDWLVVLAVVVLWAAGLRLIWRGRVLERLAGETV